MLLRSLNLVAERKFGYFFVLLPVRSSKTDPALISARYWQSGVFPFFWIVDGPYDRAESQIWPLGAMRRAKRDVSPYAIVMGASLEFHFSGGEICFASEQKQNRTNRNKLNDINRLISC
nr:hypothetical protein [uncultured Cohaesibacter sp.]